LKDHRESSALIKDAAMLQIRTFPIYPNIKCPQGKFENPNVKALKRKFCYPNIKFGASLFGLSLLEHHFSYRIS